MMVRIAWALGGRFGHGAWQEETPTAFKIIAAHISDLNARYGAGSHWIEYKSEEVKSL